MADFSNMGDADLADEFGKLDTRIKILEGEAKDYKAEIIRRGITAQRGKLFVLTASTSESRRLDTEALKAKYGKKLDPFYKVGAPATRVTVKAIPQIAAE